MSINFYEHSKSNYCLYLAKRKEMKFKLLSRFRKYLIIKNNSNKINFILALFLQKLKLI